LKNTQREKKKKKTRSDEFNTELRISFFHKGTPPRIKPQAKGKKDKGKADTIPHPEQFIRI